MNNIKVLIVCLLLSLIYGAGSVLFVTWNATVWGAIFGYVAKESLTVGGQTPLAFFGMMLLPMLPHLITETVSYLSASIAGGVLSKAALREELFSKKFNHILTDALILVGFGVLLVIIAGLFEVGFF